MWDVDLIEVNQEGLTFIPPIEESLVKAYQFFWDQVILSEQMGCLVGTPPPLNLIHLAMKFRNSERVAQ